MHFFRLHLKLLSGPFIPIEEMLSDMRQAFAPAEVDFEHVSTEELSMDHLTDLDVGGCEGSAITPEQEALYSLRNGVVEDELVVYFVRSTDPFVEGCAAYRDETRPSAAIIARCSRWALAHEVGHLLGLSHVTQFGRLMHHEPPAGVTIPTLSEDERRTMRESRYVRFAG